MHADDIERRELISALADGQLVDDELAQTMTWVASSQEARLTWHAYHVVGDALRSADLSDCGADRDFVERLRKRLAQVDPPVNLASVTPVTVVADSRVRSANDAVLRWKWLAVAASFVTVAVLGWHVGSIDTGSPTQLAAGSVAAGQTALAGNAAVSAEPPVMLRDPRLDELLAAHRQFGGTSALQMPSGFLRNATFEQPGR